MTIEERKNIILAKIAEIKQGGTDEEKSFISVTEDPVHAVAFVKESCHLSYLPELTALFGIKAWRNRDEKPKKTVPPWIK